MRFGCQLYSRESTPLFLWDRRLGSLRDRSEHCVGTNILVSAYNRSTNPRISDSQLRQYIAVCFFCLWRFDPILGHGLTLRGFAITLTGHTTLGRTPLDERSTRRRDLYLTTHNIHKRRTRMPQAGSEPTIPARERPHSHAFHTTICAM
jgi:hypothetical protein